MINLAALDAPVSALLRGVARDVVLPGFRNLAADEIMEKAPGDYVTVADQESERRLTAGLLRILPEARVIGEEACAADPALVETIGEGLVWVVDPIDGTHNYSEGIEPFAIMVALLRDGLTQAGWILAPVSDRMCHARIGEGAFVNGARIQSRGSGEAVPLIALPYYFLPDDVRADYDRRFPGKLQQTPIPRCAGEQYPRLALGQNDVALFWKMFPWDHAAGALFLTEAGGRVAHFDGTPYRPDRAGKGLIGAATSELWAHARAVLAD